MLEEAKKPITTYEEIVNTLEILSSVVTGQETHFEKVKKLSYPVYNVGKVGTEELCGNLMHGDIYVDSLNLELRSQGEILHITKQCSAKTEKTRNLTCKGNLIKSRGFFIIS